MSYYKQLDQYVTKNLLFQINQRTFDSPDNIRDLHVKSHTHRQVNLI